MGITEYFKRQIREYLLFWHFRRYICCTPKTILSSDEAGIRFWSEKEMKYVVLFIESTKEAGTMEAF